MLKTVAKIHKHISAVQELLRGIYHNLEYRALHHDDSKFEADELKGYLRFKDMPEGLEYGSDEYKTAMQAVMENNNCFELHSQRNDHHPEYHNKPSDMGWLSIIEMVCDWGGAHVAYGNKGNWDESVEHNIDRYDFTDAQKWLIRQVASHILF